MLHLAVVAMLATGCESRVDRLLRRMQSSDAAARRDAIVELRNVRVGPDDAPLARPGIGSLPEQADDRRIVRALSRAVVDDPDREVRTWAAYALRDMRPPGRNDALLTCARSDPDVGTICADALIVVADPANLEDMVAMFGKNTCCGRNRIMSRLGDVGPVALPFLARLAMEVSDGTEDQEIAQTRAVGQLGAMATPEAFAAIVPALRSASSTVRYVAIEELAKGGEEYRGVIEPLLHDPAEGVRAAAARALGTSSPTWP